VRELTGGGTVLAGGAVVVGIAGGELALGGVDAIGGIAGGAPVGTEVAVGVVGVGVGVNDVPPPAEQDNAVTMDAIEESFFTNIERSGQRRGGCDRR
jgi:hypothetical protein